MNKINILPAGQTQNNSIKYQKCFSPLKGIFASSEMKSLTTKLIAMFKTKVLLVTAALFCISLISYAQSQTVKGKVLDNEGLEVIGGSVIVKGVPGGGHGNRP